MNGPSDSKGKSNEKKSEPLVVGGWTLYMTPLFEAAVEELARKVKSIKTVAGQTAKTSEEAKRLKCVLDLMHKEIPSDPNHKSYRPGKSLDPHSGWYRAKFMQQYRLFFRFDSTAKIIVYSWLNDDTTLRAYESKKDAYKVFKSLLDNNTVPTDWKSLLKSVAGQATAGKTTAPKKKGAPDKKKRKAR